MMQMAIAAPRCLLPPNQAALSKQLYGATRCLRLEPTRLRAGGRAAADVGFPPSTANKAAVPVDPRILTIARGCRPVHRAAYHSRAQGRYVCLSGRADRAAGATQHSGLAAISHQVVQFSGDWRAWGVATEACGSRPAV